MFLSESISYSCLLDACHSNLERSISQIPLFFPSFRYLFFWLFLFLFLDIVVVVRVLSYCSDNYYYSTPSLSLSLFLSQLCFFTETVLVLIIFAYNSATIVADKKVQLFFFFFFTCFFLFCWEIFTYFSVWSLFLFFLFSFLSFFLSFFLPCEVFFMLSLKKGSKLLNNAIHIQTA